MKKYNISTLIFVILFYSIKAQERGVLVGEVVYDFIHSIDSVHGYVDSINDITKGRLLFAQTKSKFISGVVFAKKESSPIETIEGFTMRLSNMDTIGNVQFVNQLTDSMYSREIYINKELITAEKIPKISWLIENEYKDVKNIKCQKAVGVFRGRTYIAWFTEKIAVSAGPWKLSGLPGLILEAYDSTRQIQFLLQELNYPSHRNIVKDLVPGIDISKSFPWEEVEKRRLNIQRSYKAVAEGLLPEGASINMTFTEKNVIERAY